MRIDSSLRQSDGLRFTLACFLLASSNLVMIALIKTPSTHQPEASALIVRIGPLAADGDPGEREGSTFVLNQINGSVIQEDAPDWPA